MGVYQVPPGDATADLAGKVARALGGAKRVGNDWRARCPVHDGRNSNLSLSNGDTRALLVKCWSHQCDPKDILREIGRRGLLDDKQRDWKPRVVEPKPQPDQDKLRWLLKRLLPIEGTVVETYLKDARGVDLPPEGHDLRYLPAKPPKYPWPCMVGIITHLLDVGRILSLHFTRLALDGRGKAPLPKDEQRSFLAGFPIKGGVIRLCDDADVTLRLGVGEGVETSLSIMTTYRRDEGRFEPVWAALSATVMADLAVPDGIETLVVYADRGQAGEAAADKLAERWLDAGREVFIAIAPFDDWNQAVAS